MSDSITRLLAYAMCGMGIGILVKAAGGGPELTVALGVLFVCGIEVIKYYVQKE